MAAAFWHRCLFSFCHLHLVSPHYNFFVCFSWLLIPFPYSTYLADRIILADRFKGKVLKSTLGSSTFLLELRDRVVDASALGTKVYADGEEWRIWLQNCHYSYGRCCWDWLQTLSASPWYRRRLEIW